MNRATVAFGVLMLCGVAALIIVLVTGGSATKICIETAQHTRAPASDCTVGHAASSSYAAWYIYSGSVPAVGQPVNGGGPTPHQPGRGAHL